MHSRKIAFFAAAATLTFAGAASAQSTMATPTPGQQKPQAASPAAAPALPATTPTPPALQTPADMSSTTTTTTTATSPAQPSADTSAAPASATVTSDFKVGTEVKDPAGVSVGTISGASAAADGSVNVVITNGGVKFALPSASLSSNAGALTTTATKAQIDATLAGAKPQ
ncbi:hypothetical protein ACN2C6_02850 [Caulobacter sp. ErkDOM-YI]|uniref:hypothetical protein n=1 Tax=unclassified Caulobacter TaxID=2648921 RepID=UPI003AF6FB45